MAEALGYRPNLAARYLQSRKQLRIAVHLPRQDRALLGFAARGHSRSRGAVRAGAARRLPRLPAARRRRHSAVRRGAARRRQRPHHRARQPGGARAAPARRPRDDSIPVVCVVTDAPESPRLTSVSADPFTVGAVAGELLARFLPGGGEVAFFTGWLAMQDHADKLRGFESSLRPSGSGLARRSDRRGARRRARGASARADVLRAHPDLKGIYVSTVNSLPVLRAAEQEGRLPGSRS